MNSNKKIKNGWAFYDWANSVYSLVISTAVFPIYYQSITPAKISIGGMSFHNTALYDYVLSLSVLVVILVTPLLSGIADYTGRKKSFLRRFCYAGALACMGMFFFADGESLWIGLLFSMLASIGFWGGLVFYNAYLPEIAPKEEQDALSAKGYALGYFGSSILLIFSLVFIQSGWLDTGLATRIVFLITGLWWAGFAQVTFARLPESTVRRSVKWSSAKSGYAELKAVWHRVAENLVMKRFMLAFFMISTGVQTVILVASLFGSKTLGLETAQLITTILLIQIVGIFGSMLFARLSGLIGNIRALSISVVIWVMICGTAYMLTPNDPDATVKFYVIGGAVGLVLGGVQSLSRSTYAKMLPEGGEHTTFFSFYDVTEKAAIVLGTFTFGLLEDLTGSMNNSVLALAVFFLIGFFLLQFVRMPKAAN